MCSELCVSFLLACFFSRSSLISRFKRLRSAFLARRSSASALRAVRSGSVSPQRTALTIIFAAKMRATIRAFFS